MVTERVARWASRLGGVGKRALVTGRISRLNIGQRLLLCFACIVLTMLCGGAVVLWQFQVVRAQATRLNAVDQKLVAVLRVHVTQLAFYRRLEELAESQDTGRLVAEARAFRDRLLEEALRARAALEALPPELPRDPTILPMLMAVQSALPPQLDTIRDLAVADDWRGVRLRLANQVRPIEALTSELVEKVYEESIEEQAEAVQNIELVQARILLVVPATVIATLLIALTLGLLVTRSITQPLARLVAGSQALAQGDFRHQVSFTGRDELAQLAEAFNHATQRLRDVYATLQSSEDRLRLTIDTIPANVWSATPDGSVDFVSQRVLEVTGLPAPDLLGSHWETAVHPDDRARFRAEWGAALERGRPAEVEVRMRRADGAYRWWLIRNVPLREAGGSIVKWYGAGLDITERKLADEELQIAHLQLAHANRVATMGQLTASIAHEVNQPIAAAVTNAQAGLRWLTAQPPAPEEVRQALGRIIESGKRAAEVIARIRSLIKRAPARADRLDLNEAIQDVVALTRSEALKCGVSLKTDLAEGLPSVMGDRVQLQQVFLNLIVNALEAMSGLEAGVRELLIRTERDAGGGVLVSVRDTGPGLGSQGVDSLFEAFYTTKAGGMGMGLSICRSIVEAHHGRLWASANEPRGAVFQLTLPTGPDETAPSTDPVPAA